MPDNTLTVSLIQTSLYWHEVEANLAMLEEKIWQIDQPTDLIILPEMFSTGFTQQADSLAEPMNSKTFRWMKQQAAQTKAVVTGSYIVREQQNFYNRLLWVRPDGTFSYYDKRHLFRMAGEDRVFSAGDSLLIEELKGWRVCPLICYDLRFPVWSRNVVQADGALNYDLLIYVANWPAARRSAWETLLKARAIENACYVAGVNRVGEDGNQVSYLGNSVAVDFKGDIVADLEEQEQIITIPLSYQDLEAYRQKFPVHLDADKFLLGS
ncbi:amidohydrolase [Tunicatimonas pelagia]|uniref:amidohydrolase n=1 Tax=Tunicatimonas pelagia TaxID=931531 RepID=UPI0026659CA5|nr:amidohydrolase [Tunicatimonas pelagia]WKN45990.1 amidohydrolase [Tunicatimonas pelagia]